MLEGNGSSEEINSVCGEGADVCFSGWLTWRGTTARRCDGRLFTSGAARARFPLTTDGGGRASKGNLPAPDCYPAPKINCSECDVMAWLQNALVALLGSPTGLHSSSRSRDRLGPPPCVDACSVSVAPFGADQTGGLSAVIS